MITRFCILITNDTLDFLSHSFSFITPADGTEDIFVHQTEIRASGFRSLAENEAVEYDTVVDENGRPKASNVTGPNGNPVQGAPKPQFREYQQGGFDGQQQQNDFRGPRRGGFGGPRGGNGGFRQQQQMDQPMQQMDQQQ